MHEVTGRANKITNFVWSILVLRFQFLLSIIVSVVVVFVAQSREVLRIHAEAWNSTEYAFAVASVLFLAAIFWNTGRVLTMLYARSNLADGSGANSIVQLNSLERWLPRLCGWVVIFATGVAMFLTLESTDSTTTKRALIGGGIGMILMSIVFLYFVTHRTRLFNQSYEFDGIPFRRTTWVFGALYFVILVATLASPVTFPQAIGSLALTFVFVALAVHVLTGTQIAMREREVPALTLLLVWAAVLSLFDWNDNHHLAMEGPPTPCSDASGGDCELPTAVEAFDTWLDNRKVNVERYEAEGETYPVYVVAAQGGGIYAAYHASIFLSRLQDSCPAFAKQVFAISGVSGGSIGSTVWADLIKNGAPNSVPPTPLGDEPECDMRLSQEGPFETVAHQTFSEDLLSPVLAKSLYGETLQAILPTIGFLGLAIPDQAKALEAAITNALTKATQSDNERLRSTSVESLGLEDKIVPSLVLNSTSVGSGKRVPFAPFSIRAAGLEVFHNFSSPVDGSNAREAATLVEAAVVSARFPYITAPGSLDVPKGSNLIPETPENCDAVAGGCGSDAEYSDFDGFPNKEFKLRLVDGGYFEGSGVATALDLIEDIAFQAEGMNVQFHLIVLNSLHDEPTSQRSFSEVLSPIVALNLSRAGRSQIAKCLAEKAPPDKIEAHPNICGTGLPDASPVKLQLDLFGHELKVHYNTIDLRSDRASLGWHLSKETTERLRVQIGYDRDACQIENAKDHICLRNLDSIAQVLGSLK